MERRNQSVSSFHCEEDLVIRASPTVATESFADTPVPLDSGPRHNTGPPASAQASNCAMALELNWNAPVNGQPQEELVKVMLLPMLAQQEASTVRFPNGGDEPWKPEVSVPDSNPESGGEVHPDGMGIDADAEDVALVLAEADVDSETEADAMMDEDLRSCF
ncbi:hypothetical protein C8F01DRAFT_1127249 [Mycena amicta]|nr:hypothetical protein C8F01DRAFT_1127249 [Mycena amicta]